MSLVSACALGDGSDDPTIESALLGTASISLSSSATRVSQTTDSAWELDKVGSVSGNTVTWNITATKSATSAGQLLIQGQMTVTNTGAGPATIGNIVVNLQSRINNKWVTRSSDIADATLGDAATTANLHKAASSEGLAFFSENNASGTLEFMDATNNTVFSLTPQVLIGAGQTRALLFSASFNNAVLGIATGSQIRAETIISFGNATTNGNSTANIDINGNGTLDADEARIRSVPSRLTLTVPAPVNGNTSVTLSDTDDDIATSGTVSVTNVTFNIGATSGTVVAEVDGGTDGGTITNCAHLTSPDQTVNTGGFTFITVEGLDLTSCSSVAITGSGGGGPCTPGTVGCGWKVGDMNTRTEPDWNSLTGWTTAYNTVYASTFGAVEVGIKGTAGFSMRFNSTVAIQNYLITSGVPAALNADLINPTTSSAGIFGGAVLSLQLDVDFSNAGLLGGTSGLKLGDLTLCDMADASLDGRSVTNFLALVNSLLGGSTSSGYSISALHPITAELTNAFHNGTPSSWAQQHLVNGSCP